jgi:hypothetical protein
VSIRAWWVAIWLVAGCSAAGCGGAGDTCAPQVIVPQVGVMARAAMRYGQQLVVTCAPGDSRLWFPAPLCEKIAGMTVGLGRDTWSANYLNFDDPADPANRDALGPQRYVSLTLADASAYQARALIAAGGYDGFRRQWLAALLQKQLPSPSLGLGVMQTLRAGFVADAARDVTLDASGAFAHSATLDAGPDRQLGTADDLLTWRWNGHAPFHTAAVAETLAAWLDATSDGSVREPLERASDFLMRQQRSDGSWAYGFAPDRTADELSTAVIARLLGRLARASLANAASLDAAARRATGWLAARPAASFDAVGAGAAIQALLDEGDAARATALGEGLLARLVAPVACGFGSDALADDRHAVGGVPGADGSQSPWVATYGVPGLRALCQASGDPRFCSGADLMVAWTLDKLAAAQAVPQVVQLPDLLGGVIEITGGTWWGLMPEAYFPRADQIEAWLADPALDLGQRPRSWLETTTGVDLERLLARRANTDPYWAHITQPYPWQGGPWRPPSGLGELAPAVNGITSADAALALFGYAGY